MNKSKAYSYSKLSCYKQCPKRYFWNHIEKIPRIQVDTTALLKGRAVHNILEVYPQKSTHKLAHEYQHIADNFIQSDLGKKYLPFRSENEFKFGLNKLLQPCDYNDPDGLFRGIIDRIIVIDSVLYLIDFKTGKLKDIRWQEFDQLMFYAIYFFRRYPSIDQINISYVYVEHNSENSILLDRKYLKKYIEELVNLIKSVQYDTEFKKNKTKLCEWCDLKEYCSKN